MPIRHHDADLVRAITAYPAMRSAAPIVLPRGTSGSDTPARPSLAARHAATAWRVHRWFPRLAQQAG